MDHLSVHGIVILKTKKLVLLIRKAHSVEVLVKNGEVKGGAGDGKVLPPALLSLPRGGLLPRAIAMWARGALLFSEAVWAGSVDGKDTACLHLCSGGQRRLAMCINGLDCVNQWLLGCQQGERC